MAEAPQARIWAGRIGFILICIGLTFINLLPLDALPVPEFPAGWEVDDPLPAVGLRWGMPDLILVVILAWVTRRPDFVPASSIAAVLLLTDLLFQRPPGLWAALVLLLSEFLRSRSNGMRALPFAVEWVTVMVGIVVITVINRVVLLLVDVPQAAVSLTVTQTALTCVAYPVVCVIAHLVFGVSRPAPGEVDALGHRL